MFFENQAATRITSPFDNYKSYLTRLNSSRNSNSDKSIVILDVDDTPTNLFKKVPPRSFSIDIGLMSFQSLRQHNSYSDNKFLVDNLNKNIYSQSDEMTSTCFSFDLFGISKSNPSRVDNGMRRNSTQCIEENNIWTQQSNNTPTRNLKNQLYDTKKYIDTWQESYDTILPSNFNNTTKIPSYYQTITSNTKNICQHIRQFGYCSLKEKCPSNVSLSKPFHSTPNTMFVPSKTLLHNPSSVTKQIFNNTSGMINENSPSSIDLDALIYKQIHCETSNIEELKGRFYELSKHQYGCRFLQSKLECEWNNCPEIKAILFDEIIIHMVELTMDPFGNYLCQKLLNYCNDQQIDSMIQTIIPELLKICTNTHGTRTIQRLIEFLKLKPQLDTIIIALEPIAVILIKDIHGNHVIQKCLKLDPKHNQFIYNTVSMNCVEIASHKHGCCVLQRSIDYATISQRAQVIGEIINHALTLVRDPYGNYVVQHVLGLNDSMYYQDLAGIFIGPIQELSIQKFSSNVIEKCIQVSDKETKRKLISGMMKGLTISRLLQDSYANYVIQTCLDFAEADQRTELIELIRPLLSTIRHTPYGKRIHSKIQPTSFLPNK